MPKVSVAGQTLFASTVAQLTRRSIEVTVLVALVIELVILVLYLRALVAPVVLLAASALSVAAALGLTTFLFQDVLGQSGLTFYAPFAAAVLLIALGADYTVFSVGSIWEAASRKPLAEAIMDARAAYVASDYHSRCDLGGDVRARRDHSAGDVPPDRFCRDRRVDDRHLDRPAGADACLADPARASRQLAATRITRGDTTSADDG